MSQPPYGPPDYGYGQRPAVPPQGQQPYSQPVQEQLQYGQPTYDQPQHRQQYGQPAYESPQQGQQYGQPQYEQNQYAQPQYDQNQYDQPQYGQPSSLDPYGQPAYGYQMPPAAKKSQLPWIIAAVLAVVVGVGVTLALTLGGNSGPGSAGDPVQAVQGYFNAAKSGSVSEAKQYVCSSQQATIEGGSDFTALSQASFSVGTATINGESATVPVTVTAQGQSLTLKVGLIKESGDWKVCSMSYS